MKALPKLLFALTAVAVTSLFSVESAKAFTVTINQVGANVVATGSGAFNLTGLTNLGGAFAANAGMRAGIADITVASGSNLNLFTGFSGPSSFGPGGLFFASSNSGASVTLIGSGGLTGLYLPAGYVSGTALSDSSIYNNNTFASLGLTPGTYVWSWGRGANQNFTLVIGGAGVPDGGMTVSLLGCAFLGLAALRRFLMG